jgi:hypothetical protein
MLPGTKSGIMVRLPRENAGTRQGGFPSGRVIDSGIIEGNNAVTVTIYADNQWY